jgi:hypothetical protein
VPDPAHFKRAGHSIPLISKELVTNPAHLKRAGHPIQLISKELVADPAHLKRAGHPILLISKERNHNASSLKRDGAVIHLVGTLYRLPINGRKIREQVDGLKITQENISSKREIFVELPAKANSSKVMREFIDALA